MSDETVPNDPQPVEKSGVELAREALAQAKADARKRGALPGRTKKKGRDRLERDPGRGGAPKAFGSAIRELMSDRGWQERAAVGGLFGRWAEIVGPELAEHTIPETFENGILTINADSTAWATQLRLLAPQLVKRLNTDLGHNSVQRVKVAGPAAAPRQAGRWRAQEGGKRRS